MKNHTLLSVNIELQSYRPTNAELVGRAAVLKELCDRQAGKFLRAGSGMGCLDFAFEVEHEQFSKAKIGLLVGKHLPGYKFTMHGKPVEASKDFAAAVHDRRKVRDRRHEPQQAKDGFQRGPGMGM